MKLIYKSVPNSKKGDHFGSRIVFDKKGHIYFGVGDRANREKNPQVIFWRRFFGKVFLQGGS